MQLNVGKEITFLKRMSVNELRGKYAEVFGEPTNARHKDWLVKRIIWRMQANAEGNLSERALRRAAEIANDADLRKLPPREPEPSAEMVVGPKQTVHFTNETRLPPPGTILVRDYKGRRIQVLVLASGFEFEGEAYKSLSAVAKAATGQHINGFHFFRLHKEGV